MTPSTHVPVRIPSELLARIDAIAARIEPVGRGYRSRVIIEALGEGLAAVERRYPKPRVRKQP